MSDLYDDLETFGVIRTKVNNLNGMIQVAETDEEISAGRVTTIPIIALEADLLFSGDKVWLMDCDTGVAVELTLDDNAESADEVLTITSHVFADDVPAGSKVYFKYTDLLAKIYAHLAP